MSTSQIRDIVPGMGGIKIKVRVSRMWRGKILRLVQQYDGLGCVLVNEYGDSIHAVVMEADTEDVLSNMTEGPIYEISKFRIMKNQESHQIVPHKAQLQFNNKTVFKLMREEFPAIPIHSFNLLDYNELPARNKKDTILTDIIGLIKEMHQVKDALLKGKLAKKRELRIQNTRNEELQATLWEELALDFDADKMLQLPPPAVIVITSSKVTTYSEKIVVNTSLNSCVFINPNIPELQEYKTRFSSPNYAPKLIPSSSQSTGSSVTETSKIINIGNLILQDADENTDSTFTCRAKITKINIREGWYYFGCPICRVKLQMGSDSALNKCPMHGEQAGKPMYKMQVRLEDEDNSTLAMLMGKPVEILFRISCGQLVDEGSTDKIVIPKIILDTEHKYKIWKIGFGSRKDFMVRAVYPDTEKVDQEIEEAKTSEKLPSKRKSRVTKRKHSESTVGIHEENKMRGRMQ